MSPKTSFSNNKRPKEWNSFPRQMVGKTLMELERASDSERSCVSARRQPARTKRRKLCGRVEGDHGIVAVDAVELRGRATQLGAKARVEGAHARLACRLVGSASRPSSRATVGTCSASRSTLSRQKRRRVVPKSARELLARPGLVGRGQQVDAECRAQLSAVPLKLAVDDGLPQHTVMVVRLELSRHRALREPPLQVVGRAHGSVTRKETGRLGQVLTRRQQGHAPDLVRGTARARPVPAAACRAAPAPRAP